MTERQDQDWATLLAVVRRYVLNRLRQPDLADDIAQNTVLRIIEYQQDNIVVSLYALSFRIADNQIREYFRKLKPTDALDAADDFACAQPLPDRVAEDRAETQAVLAALASMPPLRRNVFMRRRLDGESCQDIGRALGLNVKAIEKHITRALLDLNAARRRWHMSDEAQVSDTIKEEVGEARR
ncbi:hypothetical protein AEAC466_05250 [Asticcacaulis sp. AC466]|uniref:RNA polymerase sigma factor n=1 Tax=Asticcacaulis sp. AC466 TaxID=1282362 RepID=UPI0003C3BC91|nr:sigma-70 family RNA polymerase sigma factor [Asticcacaulis sp. AC466]ESQ85118.1 hypothetical protein AEAC466_05250 [Asticcacaulis sp. AC466]